MLKLESLDSLYYVKMHMLKSIERKDPKQINERKIIAKIGRHLEVNICVLFFRTARFPQFLTLLAQLYFSVVFNALWTSSSWTRCNIQTKKKKKSKQGIDSL